MAPKKSAKKTTAGKRNTKPQKMPRAPTKKEIAAAEKKERELTRKFKEKVEATSKPQPAPARGARTAAKEREAKAAKKQKRHAKGQVTLSGEPLPPPPAVSLEEREIVQRIATTEHFRASIDTDDLEEIRSSATFLQRRIVVRGKMKALAKVEAIPEGAKDAECDEITRAIERQYFLKAVPHDLPAATRSTSTPATREMPVKETARPVAAKPKTFEVCPACNGDKTTPSKCADAKCGEPLYAHDCGLGKKVTCATCNGTGNVPCRRCNGHGEVEWMPEGAAIATSVSCPMCRPADHAKDLDELHPCACGAPKLQHHGRTMACPDQVTTKGGHPNTYDPKPTPGAVAFPKESASTEGGE